MTFESIIDMMPAPLRELFMQLSNVPQNPVHHPEGDVFVHTRIVTKRVIKYTDSIDLTLAAIFHDLGKIETLAFTESGAPTAHGHEKVSARLVLEWGEWIESMGGNVEKIEYVVKNHMRLKVMADMRPVKKDSFIRDPFFVDLMRFGQHDRRGTDV